MSTLTSKDEAAIEALKRRLWEANQRDFISLSAFARLVGMAYKTAKRLAENGTLNTVQVGGITRVTIDEVARYIAQGNAPQLTAGPNKYLQALGELDEPTEPSEPK